MTNNEIPITFNKNYLIYDNGKIYSLISQRYLKGQFINGTHFVDIKHSKRKSKRWSVNKLVYHHFVKKLVLLNDDYVVIPIDGNPNNHNAKNLVKYQRQKHIQKLILDKGVNYGGGISPIVKYDANIKEAKENGATLKQLANQYNVSDMAIHRSLKRSKNDI